ncbi:MAG TPA: hypothetical protein VGM27_20330 [Acidobacteriaceae bacterium]
MSAHNTLGRDTFPNLGPIPQMRRRASSQSKLDTLAWSAGLSFIAYGVRIGVRANRADVMARSVDYLPLGWKPSSSPIVEQVYSIICDDQSGPENGVCFHLYKDNQRLLLCGQESQLLECLEADVTLQVAESTRRRVFVHAGVVSWGGRAILIPGRTFSGKTTLVAELVRAGAVYYSDEFAVIDHNGLVHPYARPLQLREDGGFRQTKRPVEELGGVAGHAPLLPGLVLLSRYEAGARWHPRHISAGQALLGLLDNTVSARRGPAAALRVLKQVVTQSFAVKGSRGEGQEVVDWITTHFDPQCMFPSPIE